MKKAMMKLIVVACIALGASLPATTANAEEGCSPIGSWYGYYAPGDTNLIGPRWISTISGASNSSGALALELNGGYDFTLSNWFPTAVDGTLIRGTWKRIGDNKLATSSLAMVRDASGNTVYIVKMYGTDTLIDGCNTVAVNVTLEILDPVTFESLTGPMPQALHYGHRIVVEP